MDSEPMSLSFLSPLQELSGLFTTISSLFGHTRQHGGSLFPDQELNPCSLQWKPRKSPSLKTLPEEPAKSNSPTSQESEFKLFIWEGTQEEPIERDRSGKRRRPRRQGWLNPAHLLAPGTLSPVGSISEIFPAQEPGELGRIHHPAGHWGSSGHSLQPAPPAGTSEAGPGLQLFSG
ncbi:unnamed protein product [Rangifer tarandus platyrhynchus]|uniref:Uncharacterized protein n=2 Tax=Rangifer tarandus platyrhynchus TaxID=3082113 RepID=A0AC59ZLS7_RANTA|nr:unnamed protein product [Rangifer tarandus platyrhynchus]